MFKEAGFSFSLLVIANKSLVIVMSLTPRTNIYVAVTSLSYIFPKKALPDPVILSGPLPEHDPSDRVCA